MSIKMPIIVLLMIIASCFGCAVTELDEIDDKTLNSAEITLIQIKNASVGEGVLKALRNHKIRITDRKEIEKHKRLFFNNRQFLHACGYTYDIEFWSKSKLIKLVSYNMECGLEEFERDTEEIRSLMEAHHERFLKRL